MMVSPSRRRPVRWRLLPLVSGLVLLGAAGAQPPAFARLLGVGVADGDPRLTFGVVPDVSADARGNFAVLDEQSQTVRVFSPQGRFVQEVGRPGRGPGEFAVPVALSYDHRASLHVLDIANQRVETFAPTPAGLRYARSFRIDFPAHDLCTMNGRVYLLGYREGRIVHAYTPDGRLVRSFGAPQHPRDTYLRSALSRGYLGCSGGSIVVLPMLSPDVRAFAEDGTLRWTTRLPAYEPVVIEREGRRTTYRPGPSGRHHTASAAAPLSAGSVLVQVGFIQPGARSRHEIGDLDSYAVSLRDGALRRLPPNTPRIVQSRGSNAYAVQTDPFPMVVVYRFGGAAGSPR